ncbi:hypothetical protein ACJMK2_004081, partial [Sinanodonta woodiana]
MSVDDLVQILPKLVDTVALKLFVDEGIRKKHDSHCHDTVPAEFQDKCISAPSLMCRKRTMERHCKINALKENRNVNMGWIQNGKQGQQKKVELAKVNCQEITEKKKSWIKLEHFFSQQIMPHL